MTEGELEQLCPMCGAPASGEAARCQNCGEMLRGLNRSETHKLIRQFRFQTLWLCVSWSLIGLVTMFGGGISVELQPGPVLHGFGLFAAILLGLAFMRLGFNCQVKKAGSYLTSLIVSYLFLFVFVALLNLWGIAVAVVMVIQSHRVFHTARQMQRAGIPLSTPIPR